MVTVAREFWIRIVHTVQAEEVVGTDWVFFTIFPNPAIDFFPIDLLR